MAKQQDLAFLYSFPPETGFNYPYGIAISDSENIYLADTDNCRILKLSLHGDVLFAWGTYGSGDGQFERPCGIAVDSSENIYVADTDNDRIQKFTSDGIFLKNWGKKGSENGEFAFPGGLAVDNVGNVYEVTIKIYDMNGHLIRILNLGYKETGLYITRDSAAYWDGKTDTGERASSGVYFYNILTNDYGATKKMIIIQ